MNYLEKRINDECDRKYRVLIYEPDYDSTKFSISVTPSCTNCFEMTNDTIDGYYILRDILIEDGMLEKEGDRYLNAYIENLENGYTADLDNDVKIDVFTIEKLNNYAAMVRMKGYSCDE